MLNPIAFYSDKSCTVPVHEAHLQSVSQDPDRNLLFTCFMAEPVYFTASWDTDANERDLTFAFYKVVGNELPFCFSETTRFEFKTGKLTLSKSFRLLDVPWGAGTYVMRLFVDRTAVAEGTIKLAYD